MPARTTILIKDEFYHLYNRGNSKQVIFHDDQDYRYFMNLLSIMNTESRFKTRFGRTSVEGEENIISIGAYCLMPNHFHILVKQEKDGGIKLFMQKLSTAYVMYYNKKYKRTGALFEGRFKSKHAGEDRYLKYLFSYIHLNPLKILDQNWKNSPIRHDKQTFLSEYPYSSFNEYQTGEHSITNVAAFPEYFPSKTSFVNEMSSWLRLRD